MAGGGKHTNRPTVPQSPGTGGRGNDPCDIHFETTLNSIDPVTINTVVKGAKLQIEVKIENNSDRLIATFNGAKVGVISHPNTLDVIGCIHSGNKYLANVLERQGNLCRVRVERQTI